MNKSALNIIKETELISSSTVLAITKQLSSGIVHYIGEILELPRGSFIHKLSQASGMSP